MAEWSGGCGCGAIRYRLDQAPEGIGYCHCAMCRKASGAPVLVFGTVPFAAFHLTAGEPRRRRSSSFGERWFCGDCGAQIAMRVDYQPDSLDVTIATLDEPERAPPAFHIWHADRIGWFDTADTLPRFADAGHDGPPPG